MKKTAVNETQRIIKNPEIGAYVTAFVSAKDVEGLRPRTLDFYRQKLWPFLVFCSGRGIDTLDLLTTNEVREYLRWLKETHNPGGVAAHYRALKACTYWIEDEIGDWISPCRKVKMPRHDIEPLEPASLKDIQKLIDSLPGKTIYELRDRAIFLVLLDTGCRAGELLALERADYDPISGELILRKTKNRQFRPAYCVKETRRALRRYLAMRTDDQAPLFLSRYDRRIGYDGLRAILNRRLLQAGLPHITLHQIRRTFALETLRAGADTSTVAKLLGHSNLSTVERYLKQTGDDLRDRHARTSPVNKIR